MQSPHRALANRQAPPVARQVGVRSELGRLRASYRSRALVIAALGEAVSRWRRGAAARTAESADLRAVHDRRRSGRREGVRATAGLDAGAVLAGGLPCARPALSRRRSLSGCATGSRPA